MWLATSSPLTRYTFLFPPEVLVRAPWLIVGLFLTTACSDYELNAHPKGENGEDAGGEAVGPCIQVSPTSIDFGEVLVDDSATQPITIANRCGSEGSPNTLDLDLTAVTFDGNEEGTYSLTTLPATTLAGNEEIEVTLTFTPDAVDTFGAAVWVDSTDEASPREVVSAVGEGVEYIGEEETEPVEGEPVSDAGADQEVAPLDTVVLDGTASYDPDGNEPLTYSWSFASTPSGSSASLSSSSSPEPRFFADLAGTYELDLQVTNSIGVIDSTPDTVVIEAVPSSSFYVQLTWDTAMDLDLHLLDGSGPLFKSPGDACYCNTNPNWGGSGSTDDASLDIDAIYGYGPETTTIEAPADGDYAIRVHFYGESGFPECFGACQASEATVDLYIDGVLTETWTETLTDQGDVWEVATLAWPDATVSHELNMSSTTQISCY